MTNLPPIHLINLDRSVERLRTFEAWNGHLSNLVRVPAADGARLDRSELVEAGCIANDFEAGPGTLGCAMSHFRLWETAVRDNRSLTILEDDVIVAHHFEAAAARVMLELPPDWDFVKWGWTFNLAAWVDFGVSRVRLQGDGRPAAEDARGFTSFQRAKTIAAPVRMLHSFGLFGYSISPEGARKALDFCRPLRKRLIDFPAPDGPTEAGGIDMTLCGLYPGIEAYICFPSLIVHDGLEDSVRMNLDRNVTR